MIEQTLKTYMQQLQSLVETQDDHYVISEVLKLESLSKECKTFISSEVLWWAYTAVLRKDPGHRFPINKAHTHTLSEELLSYYQSVAECTQAELHELLNMFAESYLNGLFRPITTLASFVFRNADHKSAQDILTRLNALSIPYFDPLEVIHSMIDPERHPTSIIIAREQFQSACQDVLRSSIGRLRPEQVIDVLESLFDVMNKTGGTDAIPCELLHVFFQEAGQQHIADSLRTSYEQGVYTFTKSDLLEMLQSVMGQSKITQASIKESTTGVISSRKFFGAKGIMLLTGERLSIAKRRLLLEREVQIEHEAHHIKQDSRDEIERMLHDYRIQDKPLRLIRKSFMGSLPMNIQMHYANAVFAGDLNCMRKLGASIDKTVGVEAALTTCKAFIRQFGNPIREAKDPMEGLYNLIEMFCKDRDN